MAHDGHQAPAACACSRCAATTLRASEAGARAVGHLQAGRRGASKPLAAGASGLDLGGGSSIQGDKTLWSCASEICAWRLLLTPRSVAARGFGLAVRGRALWWTSTGQGGEIRATGRQRVHFWKQCNGL